MLYNSEKHSNCKINPAKLGHNLTDKPDSNIKTNYTQPCLFKAMPKCVYIDC